MVHARCSRLASCFAIGASLASLPAGSAQALGVARHDVHLTKRAVGISDDTMNQVIQVMEQISDYR